MHTEEKVNRFQIHKTIYAKRKPFSNKELNGVLLLEVQTHLSAHTDLSFVGVGKEVKNADRSLTFPLQFKLKDPTHAKEIS